MGHGSKRKRVEKGNKMTPDNKAKLGARNIVGASWKKIVVDDEESILFEEKFNHFVKYIETIILEDILEEFEMDEVEEEVAFEVDECDNAGVSAGKKKLDYVLDEKEWGTDEDEEYEEIDGSNLCTTN